MAPLIFLFLPDITTVSITSLIVPKIGFHSKSSLGFKLTLYVDFLNDELKNEIVTSTLAAISNS